MNQPFLKWADSKAELVPRIVQSLQPLIKPTAPQRLIEPFAGSCAVALNTPCGSALMADVNQDLIDTCIWLKRRGVAFINDCEKLFDNGNDRARYDICRQRFNETLQGDYQRALLFVYLNRHGYNGLCCYNDKGHFDVPYGMYRRPLFPGRAMSAFHAWAQTTEFVGADFRAIMEMAQPGDIVYCDPPNLPLTTIDGLIPSSEEHFTKQEHQELATNAEELAARGIPVIISNVDTPEARALYAGAVVDTFPVRRYIQDKSGARAKVWEVVALFR